jgi:putative endonuclease
LKGKRYFVYIMSSHTGVLYAGLTSDLMRRVSDHKCGAGGAFTRKYRIRRLVYYEAFGEVLEALEREKQIKGWSRAKKVALIEASNPTWRDLSEDG